MSEANGTAPFLVHVFWKKAASGTLLGLSLYSM
jgi:hypothetical protein